MTPKIFYLRCCNESLFFKDNLFFTNAFFSTSLHANKTSLQFLGPREGDPSSIVDGVNTITGDYSILE
ncbi:MAG: hypothetical protein AAGI90_06115, partial [Chlamydiota bacterium]